MFTQPEIYLGTLRIQDPVNVLTDLVVAFFSIYAFFRVLNFKLNDKKYFYFRYFFLFFGIGMILGGFCGHAFQYRLGNVWKLPGWISSSVAVIFLSMSVIDIISEYIKPFYVKLFYTINLIIAIVFVFYTIQLVQFTYTQYHSAFCLLVVVGGLQSYKLTKIKSRASVYMLVAVGITVLSAITFALKLGVSKWFNHQDISHLILCGSVIYFLKSAIQLKSESLNAENKINL